MHTAVCEKRDRRAHDVDDADGQGTSFEAVAQCQQRVCRLTRLGYEDAGIVSEDGRVSVQEVRGEFHGDRDLRELLKDAANGHAGVETGTASDEDDSAATVDRGDVLSEAAQGDFLVGNVEPATHGVDDGLGLLEDFLLHEVAELALHDLLQLDLERLDGTHVGSSVVLVHTVDVERALVDVSDIVIL